MIAIPPPSTDRKPLARRFTDEQIGAIQSQSSKIVVVNAFAGTGKTSMLEGFAAARPRAKLLYLAFNKAVQQEAASRFPNNVTVRTTHSIAYGQEGHRYQSKLGTIRALDVLDLLDLDDDPMGYLRAQSILQAVHAFIASADHQISTSHVEADEKTIQMTKDDVVDLAQDLWAMVTDVDNHDARMPHDGYVKLMHLSGRTPRFDWIMLDEAQDTNPATLDIVLNSQSGKILVGDRHQKIYGFRRAVNAMSKVAGAEIHALTQSWRLGSVVAEAATTLLHHFTSEKRYLLGMNGEGSIAPKGASLEMPFTWIHRTNAKLFANAVYVLLRDTPLAFLGGVENYNFSDIMDVWRLRYGQKSEIQNPFLRRFRDYVQLREYAEKVNDLEILARCQVVEDFKEMVPEFIARLRAEAVPETAAKVTFTTAHKSKGLEWDSVVLAEDFDNLMSEINGLPRTREIQYKWMQGKPERVADVIETEEINLIYVAMTRAKQTLYLAEDMHEFMQWARLNPAQIRSQSA